MNIHITEANTETGTYHKITFWYNFGDGTNSFTLNSGYSNPLDVVRLGLFILKFLNMEFQI